MRDAFQSTAAYYTRYRTPYPPEMFAYLASHLPLLGDERILDLGCGSGQLAIPVASYVADVLAVDPEPAMLAEGIALRDLLGLETVEFIRGSSETLAELDVGPRDAVLMGASFHWMDRAATLRELDRIVVAGGAVVLAGAPSPMRTETPPFWEPEMARIREKWLGPQRRAGCGTYEHPRQKHEQVLAESAFPVLEKTSWTVDVVRDLDSVLGLQLSFSFSAPALLGDEFPAYRAELRSTLRKIRPVNGRFAHHDTVEVIVARREER